MKSFFLALAMLLGLAFVGEALAHGGRVVYVRDGFGRVRAVVVDDFHVGPRFVDPRFVPHHFTPRVFVPRGGVTPFNQDGGPNRIGRRR